MTAMTPHEQLELILAKYINIVCNAEGVTFLYENQWSKDEWAILQRAQTMHLERCMK